MMYNLIFTLFDEFLSLSLSSPLTIPTTQRWLTLWWRISDPGSTSVSCGCTRNTLKLSHSHQVRRWARTRNTRCVWIACWRVWNGAWNHETSKSVCFLCIVFCLSFVFCHHLWVVYQINSNFLILLK